MWHGQLATPGSFWTGSWCFLLSLSCCSCSSRAPCPRSTLLCLLAPTFLSIPPWGFSCHPQRKMIMAGPPLPSQDLLHRESGFTCDLWSWCAHSWLPSTEELIFMPHWVPLISHLLGEMTQQVKVLAGKSGLFYPQNPHSGRKEQTLTNYPLTFVCACIYLKTHVYINAKIIIVVLTIAPEPCLPTGTSLMPSVGEDIFLPSYSQVGLLLLPSLIQTFANRNSAHMLFPFPSPWSFGYLLFALIMPRFYNNLLESVLAPVIMLWPRYSVLHCITPIAILPSDVLQQIIPWLSPEDGGNHLFLLGLQQSTSDKPPNTLASWRFVIQSVTSLSPNMLNLTTSLLAFVALDPTTLNCWTLENHTVGRVSSPLRECFLPVNLLNFTLKSISVICFLFPLSCSHPRRAVSWLLTPYLTSTLNPILCVIFSTGCPCGGNLSLVFSMSSSSLDYRLIILHSFSREPGPLADVFSISMQSLLLFLIKFLFLFFVCFGFVFVLWDRVFAL